MVFVIVAGTLWSVGIEPGRLVFREVDLELPTWPAGRAPIRIAALADLHCGAPHMSRAYFERLVNGVNARHPDFVVLLGDYVIHRVPGGRFMRPEVLAGTLSALRSRFGTFAVLGNHDWWWDGEAVTRAFSRAGIRVLENQSAEIRRRDGSLWLAGLADPWTRRPDLEEALEGVPAADPVIVLIHNPDFFPEIPDRVALTLAGHTHGGQVYLPFLGRLVVSSRFGQRYAIGHVVEEGRHLYVTPGLGTSIIPVRFLVPPEVTILTISGERPRS